MDYTPETAFQCFPASLITEGAIQISFFIFLSHNFGNLIISEFNYTHLVYI